MSKIFFGLNDCWVWKKFNPNQAGVSESLKRRGGANGTQEKIGYIGHIFAFLTSKILSRDSRDTIAAPNRVHDQPWSFIGPYRVLKKDLVIFKIL